MLRIFTQGCHHSGISCILVQQNLFQAGKHARTIALNTSYIVIFQNLRDASQISTLGRQLFPGSAGALTAVYRDATRLPYAYLVIDLAPNTPPETRIRTQIFVGELPVVYTLRA